MGRHGVRGPRPGARAVPLVMIGQGRGVTRCAAAESAHCYAGRPAGVASLAVAVVPQRATVTVIVGDRLVLPAASTASAYSVCAPVALFFVFQVTW